MLFNSITFFVFLAIVYTLYRITSFRFQNWILLIASYFFYGWWDVRFLFLIVLSTVVDYFSGLMIGEGRIEKKSRLLISVWLVISCFVFVVIRWRTIFPESEWATPFEGTSTIHWLVPVSVVLAMVLWNSLYPLFESLPDEKKRNVFLFASIFTNLSILGFFKYFNFFIESLSQVVTNLGIEPSHLRLEIILPVGISFYTFQTMSYTIDIYRGKLKPTYNFRDFSLFVAFFPQLVAGPIERAVNLLPQVQHRRNLTWDQSLRGIHLVLFGLFKKVAIADGVADTVDAVYNSSGAVSWIDVMVATLLFAVQIYCDFSGYTDIARGTAKLLGFELMVNFRYPYFSLNPKEFWTRWHISLSSWLRDYLYIPLGGNRVSNIATYRNLMTTMLLGGLWHGAAWTFVLWGAYQGGLLCVHRLLTNSLDRLRKYSARIPGGYTFIQRAFRFAFGNPHFKLLFLGNVIKVFIFFAITCYGWLLFRAGSMETVVNFTKTMFFDFGNLDLGVRLPRFGAAIGMGVLAIVDPVEYFNDGKGFYKVLPVQVWTLIYTMMILSLFMGLVNPSAQFIYFIF